MTGHLWDKKNLNIDGLAEPLCQSIKKRSTVPTEAVVGRLCRKSVFGKIHMYYGRKEQCVFERSARCGKNFSEREEAFRARKRLYT